MHRQFQTVRTVSGSALLIAIVILTGCRSAAPEPAAGEKLPAAPSSVPPRFPQAAPPAERPTVWFEPMDGTTNVGTTMDPRVAVDGWGRPIDAALLKQLASGVSLVTWPEMTEVPATVEVTEGSKESDPRGTVKMKPNAPLSDRWYALTVAKLPSELSWPKYSAQDVLPNGSVAARFRTGSEPTLTGIRVCPKGTVALLLSERVDAALPLSDIVTIVHVGDSGPSCKPLTQPSPQGMGDITFACTGMKESMPTKVSIGPGLKGLSGVAFADGAVTVHQFTTADLPIWGPGCGMFKP